MGPRYKRLRTPLAGCALALIVAATVMTPAAMDVGATGPTVSGSGSSWVAIALDQWRADIAQQGYHINYSIVGSSFGRSQFASGLTDFGASEIPYQPGEPHPSRAFEYFPDVAGGTALMYNLHTPAGAQITSLRLNADAAAKIFTGRITSWQDPEIQALNPGLQIRETNRIIPVVRSDGSGTSAQFSLYLASQAPGVWGPFASANGCPAPCSIWPPLFQNQNGSDGVASYVAQAANAGAIGYVEAGYAQGYGFPVAALRNVGGNYVLPTAVNVATALQHAAFNADNTQKLDAVYVAPEPNAYPMSSYSYMIAQTSGFDPAKGAVFGTWLVYIACGGQREAAPLGYSPLPPVLIQNIFDAEQRIPGAPAPPPIDRDHCPNPTVANAPGTPPAEASISQFGAGQHASPGGGAGPAATASASADATAAPSAAASSQSQSTLSATQRENAFLAAEQAALNARPASALVCVLVGLAILGAVFIPVFLGWRRAAADTRRADD